MHFKKFLIAIVFPSLILYATAFDAFAQKGNDFEYRAYVSHVAAASNALQLNETGEAKRWLAATPVKFRNWEWHYLHSLSEESAGITPLSLDSAKAIATSPDGRYILMASGDKSVRLIESISGKQIHQFLDEKISPQNLAFSSDGKYFAAAYSRHTVKLWETETGKEIRTFQGEGKGITAVAFSPDGKSIASSSWNTSQARGVWGIVEIWNTDTGESVKKLQYGVKPIVSIQYSPDGKWLAVGSWEVQNTVALWRVGEWENYFLLESEKNDESKALQHIAFSPNSKLLVAGGKDAKIRIWDVESRQRLHTLTKHKKQVNSLSFSTDGKTLASASTDQTIRLWNVDTGQELRTLHGHTKAVNSVALLTNKKQFISAANDNTLRTWTIEGAKSNQLEFDGSAYGVAFSPDGKQAVSAGWKGKLRVWDRPTGRELENWQAHKQSANAVAFSVDGKRLASVGNDGLIKIWELETKKELRVLEEVKGNQLIDIRFCGNDRIVSTSMPNSAKVFDANTGKTDYTLAHEKGVVTVVCSNDGKLYATSGTDGTLIFWDAKTGKSVTKYAPHQEKVTYTAFSPDTKTFATASSDRSAKIIDIKTGKIIFTLDGHDAAISSIAFNRDGSRIVTASSDQTVRIWDTKTGENVLSVPLNVQVYAAQFSPNGAELWVLALDDTIRILNGK
jgi:WD40 repeat protein